MGKIALTVVFLLAALPGHAEVIQNLQITQKANSLQFQIEIQNNEAADTTFQLTRDAQDLKMEGLSFQKTENGNLNLQLLAKQKGSIGYSLRFDPSQSQFLTEEVAWHPLLQSEPAEQVFSVQSKTESGIEMISSATGRTQDSLALVVGPFKVYESENHKIKVYLKSEDSELAATLLQNLNKYMAQDEAAIAPYPYDQFSVVESPDEIGFAFPKMTWIGSQLLRYPFIFTTSLPHELLHSWWGNGVFVDYKKGNWCEGLTVFGADYGLLSEASKKLYRLKIITAYLDFVKKGQDIALSDFVARGDDPALQAIGYGKAMMVFVMLEDLVGKENFQKSLQRFYQKYQYKSASWDDLFSILEDVSGQNLQNFKSYWIHSKGLVGTDFMTAVRSIDQSGIILQGHSLELSKLSGQQVEINLNFGDQTSENYLLKVSGDGKSLTNPEISLSKRPTSYSIDPQYKIFRQLSENEKPRSFSGLFTSNEIQTLISNSEWKSAARANFPRANLVDHQSSTVNFNEKSQWLISLQDIEQIPELKSRLQEAGVRFENSDLTFNDKRFDLNQNAFFLSLRVNQATVTVFSLNNQLTAARWFQRWGYYSSESYLVLGLKSAALQGLLVEEDRRSF